jgi:carbamoyl-phosphate synthase large subunit
VTGVQTCALPISSAAYLKARLATELPVPIQGGVYITVKDKDKFEVINQAKALQKMGFNLFATSGTSNILRDSGKLDVTTCYRISERKSPDALDLMRQGKIHLIINTPSSTGGAVLDGNMMRRLAVELNIPFVTTMAGAKMEVEAILEAQHGIPEPRLLDISPLGKIAI